MQGSSAGARAAVVEHLEGVLGSADVERLGDELFAVAAVLDAEPSLRRAVTDPGTPGDARSALAGQVFGGRVSADAAGIVGTAAQQRWSGSRDLADTLEHAGALAHVSAADRAGTLDEVEDELFRFGRVVSGDPGLRDAFSDRSVSVERRQQLVQTLLSDRATPTTQRLAAQAAAGRHRSLAAALDEFAQVAARRRERLVATVTVAQQPSGDATDRLAAALAAQHGRPVHLNVVVDPAVLGGVRVEIGDEVVDGTVHSRLESARRRLAG